MATQSWEPVAAIHAACFGTFGCHTSLTALFIKFIAKEEEGFSKGRRGT